MKAVILLSFLSLSLVSCKSTNVQNESLLLEGSPSSEKAIDLTPEQYRQMRNNVEIPHLVPKTFQLVNLVENQKDFTIQPSASGTFINQDGLGVVAGHSLAMAQMLDKNLHVLTGDQLHMFKVVKSLFKFSDWNAARSHFESCFDTQLTPEKNTERCMGREAVGIDAALIQIQPIEPTKVEFADIGERPKLGDKVFSVNYIEGNLNQSEGVVVPGKGNQVLGGDGITVTAYIHGGSSGGALFNSEGQLVGLTNSQVDQDHDPEKVIAGVATELYDPIEMFPIKKAARGYYFEDSKH